MTTPAPAIPPFAALLVEHGESQSTRSIVELTVDDLPPGDVLIEVAYSSVNFKDGLAAKAGGGVAQAQRLVPGIDLAGTVVADTSATFAAGSAVIVHGYGLGVDRHGGYARYARVPADWVVALPPGLSPREAMVIGTAGFTAAMSVDALERAGLVAGGGPVLVLGATGGVGSVAVALLAARGHEVVASTGSEDAERYLLDLGASSVIARDETSAQSDRPLERERWAAAVDPVGGMSLAYVLRSLRYGGSVATSGLTGGVGFQTTVLPFILRGVSVLGIDSVQFAIGARRELWARIGDDLRPPKLDEMAVEVTLDELAPVLDAILAGNVRGRTVVAL